MTQEGLTIDTVKVRIGRIETGYRLKLQEVEDSYRTKLKAAVEEGALLRVRPKAMTVLTIIVGLLPIMLGGGVGNEVMQRIAAPMVGGMVLAPLISMLVIPAVFYLARK